jgi:predicted DNA-binding protein
MAVRVPDDIKQKFIKLSAKYGGTAYVLRELIAAFVENRVEIIPPKNPLYKDSSK